MPHVGADSSGALVTAEAGGADARRDSTRPTRSDGRHEKNTARLLVTRARWISTPSAPQRVQLKVSGHVTQQGYKPTFLPAVASAPCNAA
jgi:hypothetical protein